jgi:pseudouridine-5'-phosphate glycosidase
VGAAVVVGPEVAAALAERWPVVALESAIITHGLPRPRNLEVARELEHLLRSRGVTPATVAVIDGVPTIGLAGDQLDRLGAGAAGAARAGGGAGGGAGAASGAGAAKASVRDLPVVMARRQMAGTTVAATAWLARRAGIRVFATGGIGGIHRGASTTFDESADLPTLAVTPITVVCAGVKSILDVAATLERLETLGVTVLGYRTSHFPGFYVTDSGHPAPARVDEVAEVVAVMRAADELGVLGAVVVANPVPPTDQLDPAVHDAVIAEALVAADRDGIAGPALTPYLLDRLQRATGGASVGANVAAVRNNVTLAADLAQAWAPFSQGAP